MDQHQDKGPDKGQANYHWIGKDEHQDNDNGSNTIQGLKNGVNQTSDDDENDAFLPFVVLIVGDCVISEGMWLTRLFSCPASFYHTRCSVTYPLV